MEQGIKQARVKSTGAFVQVYLHHPTGNWVNAQDCTKIYDKSDLELIG